MRFPAERKVLPSPEGSRYQTLYRSIVKPNGSIELVEDGVKDIQEEIDSWYEVTDMSYIIKQMQLGNMDVLNKEPGYYADITKMPKDMIEAMQMMIDAKTEFYKLDLDVRNQFNNDFMQWLAQAGTEDWSKKMWPDKFVESVKEEVSADVS